MKNLIIAIIVIILIVVGVLYFVKKDGAEMIDETNTEMTGGENGEGSFTTGDAMPSETMPAVEGTEEMEATQ